jgi:hypothetical protein
MVMVLTQAGAPMPITGNLCARGARRSTIGKTSMRGRVAAFSNISRRDQVRPQAAMAGEEIYVLGADSLPQRGIPRGSDTEYRLDDSAWLPGTKRRYWVYIPAQYTPKNPANLMVFQDGDRYPQPDVNAQVVFDNLIHRGEMPVRRWRCPRRTVGLERRVPM